MECMTLDSWPSEQEEKEISRSFEFLYWSGCYNHCWMLGLILLDKSQIYSFNSCNDMTFPLTLYVLLTLGFLKWPCARNTCRSGSDGNQKSWVFLLGLKYTLRTCFESKKFLSKSCPELSNQVLSFSACQI